MNSEHDKRDAPSEEQACAICGRRIAGRSGRKTVAGVSVDVCPNQRACAARRALSGHGFEHRNRLLRAHLVRVHELQRRFETDGDQPEGRARFQFCGWESDRRGGICVLPFEGFVTFSVGDFTWGVVGYWAIVESAEGPGVAAPTTEQLRAANAHYDSLRAEEERDRAAWRAWAQVHGCSAHGDLGTITDPVGRALQDASRRWDQRLPEGDGMSTRVVYARQRLDELEYAARRAAYGRSIWFAHKNDPETENPICNVFLVTWPAIGWRVPWTQELENEVNELGRSYLALRALPD